MKSRNLLIIGLVSASILTTSASAAVTYNAQTSEVISGNPIKRQDNYTINSKQKTTIAVQCKFKNTGQNPANLNIWTSPRQTKPAQVIKLQGGTQQKPARDSKTFYLNLKPMWWCQIYTPKEKVAWKFCRYFSISDAIISKYHPFNTWNKTIVSKDTSYSCKVTDEKPKTLVRFYYFE